MFDGEFKTYLDVRQLVEATYGSLDTASEFTFLTFLGNALDQMWADLRKNDRYLTEWIIEPGEGGFEVPEDVASICSATSVVDAIEGEGDDPDIPEVRTPYIMHRLGCPSACDSSPWSSTDLTLQVGTDVITPSDEPDSIEIVGYRTPDRSFFTAETVEDELCRTWKDIDLPRQFRNVYAKAVVGMVFYGNDDVPRGIDWLNLAQVEFAALKRAHPALVAGSAAEQGFYALGSKSYLTPTGCCNVAENWRFSV